MLFEYAARKSNTTHSDLGGIFSGIQIVPFMMNHGTLDKNLDSGEGRVGTSLLG